MDGLENTLPTWIPEGASGMAAIVFTDVVSSTNILSAPASDTLNEHQIITLMERDKSQMRSICQSYGGCVVKSTGDGLMICFQSAERAVACAREIQQTLAQQASQLAPEQILLHRIGIHSGDVERINQDLLGSAVNITSRLQSEAPPGGICLSKAIYDSVKSRVSLPIVEGGLRTLKGVSEPMPVYLIPYPRRVFISYRTQEPDATLAQQFHDALEQQGHQAFLAQKDLHLGESWPQRIELELKQADYFLLLLSEQAATSEMVMAEVRSATRLQEAQKRPVILPIRINFPIDSPLNYTLRSYLDPIQQREWTTEKQSPRLIQEVLTLLLEGRIFEARCSKLPALSPSVPAYSLIPQPFADMPVLEIPAGTMDPQSRFYVARDCDTVALETIQQQGVTITIKGPRQVGKSSLLSRINGAAVEVGKRVAFLDFQLFDKSALAEADRFFYQFCAWLTDVLDLEDRLDEYWSSPLGNSQRCTRYLGRYLLKALGMPLVLSMDEVERVFETDFRSDFFSMLRSWHNNRANTPLWKQLDLVLVTSTEPYQLIENLNQSPFNVGQVIQLTDFTPEQVADLNQRHSSPLDKAQIQNLITLLGGHPYLVRKALYLLASQQMAVADLFAKATDDQGPFGDHLRYHLFRLSNKPEQKQGLLQVIQTQTCKDDDVYFRLRGAGLITSREGSTIKPRCQLYARYFENRLTTIEA
ncbi:hypothetical protein BST81_02935 [Leptolyngbya sp. 'hensonii']|uniref:AAA-like domain-containing protein n=1 Tax=Leptolyngbya sp. 'hensonii' TaxID=1922337 RepID=UPI00095035A4|nr:AAA-like domain-containing protein [Leptolyngbya sp. 'hensonii']OLP19937.1 hypothetical protein BST81_02935 [Leptolyngbya sp. 'hensonii']